MRLGLYLLVCGMKRLFWLRHFWSSKWQLLFLRAGRACFSVGQIFRMATEWRRVAEVVEMGFYAAGTPSFLFS